MQHGEGPPIKYDDLLTWVAIWKRSLQIRQLLEDFLPAFPGKCFVKFLRRVDSYPPVFYVEHCQLS